MARSSERRPKYRAIADDLHRAIEAGQYSDGDKLPSEAALAEQYGVSRGAARQALIALQREGAAVGRTGSGVFVRRFRPVLRRVPERLARQQWGAGRAIWDLDVPDRSVTVDRLEVGEEPAPDYIADRLNLAPGAAVLVRRRRYLIDGQPVQLATSYLPAELVRGTAIAEPDSGPGGMYARLAELGAGPTRFVEELRARMPTLDEVDALTLSPGTPVVQIVRLALAGRRPVETNEMTLDATAYVLQYAINA